MQTQTIIIALIAVFILYRIYLRVRRSIGWQQLNPGKLQTSIIILSVLGVVLIALGASHPISLASDAAGIAIGVVLAYFGAAMTRFEQRDGRWHYRPSTWIGGIVTVLFFGRILYRVYGIVTMASAGGTGAGHSATDSLQAVAGGWSAGLMLIMFSYYAVYNIMLLRKQKEQLQPRVR
jgi:drug/metabolite transporter (DMT)-like permease